jgi:hypothetical protein
MPKANTKERTLFNKQSRLGDDLVVRELPIIRVSLTYQEEVLAHQTGFSRATELSSTANHSSRKDRYLNYHDYISQLSEAVGSEIAAAKFLQVTDFQPTLNGFKRVADIGSRIEIKNTKWLDGHLVVHQSDRIDDVAILVVGKSPTYFLVGWIPIKHAKVDQHWVQAERNWWVKQADLRPMETFLGSIYGTAALSL